ncbi:hypothetical protein PO878_21265 [Iamia majanohamensis]|uniref:Integrase SAM-like N-terminal domain-containing protein n=1 Tax=Iamia majanohamensis TaxID=467976 RepID=A0AAE9Y5D2_9ACTN|nr:hypothetical protein [Iamia majanohamensis]WCO67025.1 hypothetical protein PO878_21265 [Iamia majanohamensis]
MERTIHGRRPDAERELARLVVEVDQGRHAAAAPMTFGELLDRWLKVKALAVEPKTLEGYGWVAHTYLRPALADRKMAALRPMELDTLCERARQRRSAAVTPRAVASFCSGPQRVPRHLATRSYKAAGGHPP